MSKKEKENKEKLTFKERYEARRKRRRKIVEEREDSPRVQKLMRSFVIFTFFLRRANVSSLSSLL